MDVKEEKLLIGTIVLRVLIVLALIFSSYWGVKTFTEKTEKIDTRIASINNQLNYSQITPVDGISIGSPNGKQLYTISVKKECLKYVDTFEVYKFHKEYGGPYNSPVGGLCQLIDSLQKNSEKNLRELIRETNIGLEVEPSSFLKLKAEGLQVFIEQCIPVLDIGRDYQIDIYIRGFADGYMKYWERSFPTERDNFYHYKNVSYLESIDKGGNPSKYTSILKDTFFNDKFYCNSDLPNLRAKFYKEDLIDKLIEQCAATKVRNVYILEGFEFGKDEHNSKERRVEVFFREVE